MNVNVNNMTPKDLINYFESKIVTIADIQHRPNEGRIAFFEVSDPYDFDEFDSALRNCASFPAVLCEVVNGQISDNASANYTNSISISFMVMDAKNGAESLLDVRSRCYEIGLKILKSIKEDDRMGIIKDKSIFVEMNSNYQPVGPMATEYWGYQFDLSFVSSIGFC